MYTLILSSAYNLEVAILNDNKVIAATVSDEKRADKYMQMIYKTLSDDGLKFENISKIAVNIGPGSFTGIRVAVAIVKGLGFAKNIKYLTFTSFDMFDSENKTIILTGFSNFVYVKSADGNMQCKSIQELEKAESYVTDSTEIYNELKANGFCVNYAKQLDFADVIKKAIHLKNAHQIKPLYLRKSQAELLLDEKQKRKNNEN